MIERLGDVELEGRQLGLVVDDLLAVERAVARERILNGADEDGEEREIWLGVVLQLVLEDAHDRGDALDGKKRALELAEGSHRALAHAPALILGAGFHGDLHECATSAPGPHRAAIYICDNRELSLSRAVFVPRFVVSRKSGAVVPRRETQLGLAARKGREARQVMIQIVTSSRERAREGRQPSILNSRQLLFIELIQSASFLHANWSNLVVVSVTKKLNKQLVQLNWFVFLIALCLCLFFRCCYLFVVIDCY